MAFSKEQMEEIKEQLFKEIDKLPQKNKEEIKKYIEGLDEKQLEEFLKKNKIEFSPESQGQKASTPECIFCEIAKGKIPSYKITENKKAVAILEINPLSKAHSIILPKEHLPTEKLPKAAMSLAQKIAKKIKKKFKPEDIKIETSSLQSHAMINIIPIYKDTPLKKTKAEEKDLKQIQSKLETKTRASRKKEKQKQKTEEEIKKEISKLPKIGFRIP